MDTKVNREYRNSVFIDILDQEYAVNQFGKAQKEEGREEGRIIESVEIYRKEMDMDALAVPPEEQQKYALLLKEANEQYSSEG